MKSFKKTVKEIHFEVFPHGNGHFVECDVLAVKHPERKIFKGRRYKQTRIFRYEDYDSIEEMCEWAINFYLADNLEEEKKYQMWKKFAETP
jgi:hypothetical protein